MATTGLIIGKFLPPHAGHLALVAAARAQVDELTVLVCSLDREPIPGVLRHAWMSELCPDERVVHLDEELPQQPSEHPDFWRLWTAAILERVPAPDVVFTSEDYGDELAARLGARHVCVDRPRSRVPISGRAVRKDPLAAWRFLPPPVRAHFARRVAVVGPESTGKTTLCATLAERYRTRWVPEFARAHLDVKGAPFAPEDVALIARGQVAAEDRLARECDRVLFCDTDLATTAIYAEHYFGAAPGWLRVAAMERRYALHLLCDVDVPWVPDPQRDLPHLRDAMLARFRAALDRRGGPTVVLSGSWDERLGRACAAIDRVLG